MTDGEARFPRKEIGRLQNLMEQFPKKLKYSGIKFHYQGHWKSRNKNVMKNISYALEGQILEASNFKDLVKAYQQCIEIIAHKEQL